MTRLVVFIQLFSFDIVNKPGKTFTLPDALSTRPILSDKEEFYKEQPDFEEEEPLIKPCYQDQIFSFEMDKGENKWEAPGYCQNLRNYLETLEKSPDMERESFAKLKWNSASFFSSEGRLMRKHSPAPQIVIFKESYQDHLPNKVDKE